MPPRGAVYGPPAQVQHALRPAPAHPPPRAPPSPPSSGGPVARAALPASAAGEYKSPPGAPSAAQKAPERPPQVRLKAKVVGAAQVYRQPQETAPIEMPPGATSKAAAAGYGGVGFHAGGRHRLLHEQQSYAKPKGALRQREDGCGARALKKQRLDSSAFSMIEFDVASQLIKLKADSTCVSDTCTTDSEAFVD